MFRATVLTALAREVMALPHNIADEWMRNIKGVGAGDKALIYLGRYLYRGVIQEKGNPAVQEDAAR